MTANSRRPRRICATPRLTRRPLGPLPDRWRPIDEPAGLPAPGCRQRRPERRRPRLAGRAQDRLHDAGRCRRSSGSRTRARVRCSPRRSSRARARSGRPTRSGSASSARSRSPSARDVSEPLTRATAADAVASVHASIEVVDDRYADYTTLGTPTLIADDFFNFGCVLGPAVTAWRDLDLAAIGGRMAINGEVVGEGRGADILGHPLEALVWLSTNAAARGRPLRAGQFVTLGSLVATKWVAAGDEVRIEVGRPRARRPRGSCDRRLVRSASARQQWYAEADAGGSHDSGETAYARYRSHGSATEPDAELADRRCPDDSDGSARTMSSRAEGAPRRGEWVWRPTFATGTVPRCGGPGGGGALPAPTRAVSASRRPPPLRGRSARRGRPGCAARP